MAFMWHREKQSQKTSKNTTGIQFKRRNVVLNQFMIEAFIEGKGYLGTYLQR